MEQVQDLNQPRNKLKTTKQEDEYFNMTASRL
jgi:hypothetical protein